mmetsp:Transcript_48119/g.155734  ORF Transcript_48119/g.155734 Transcript_48119/m.155734 type:complete len:254 (+) Transcript_48119:365-1126(+)
MAVSRRSRRSPTTTSLAAGSRGRSSTRLARSPHTSGPSTGAAPRRQSSSRRSSSTGAGRRRRCGWRRRATAAGSSLRVRAGPCGEPTCWPPLSATRAAAQSPCGARMPAGSARSGSASVRSRRHCGRCSTRTTQSPCRAARADSASPSRSPRGRAAHAAPPSTAPSRSPPARCSASGCSCARSLRCGSEPRTWRGLSAPPRRSGGASPCLPRRSPGRSVSSSCRTWTSGRRARGGTSRGCWRPTRMSCRLLRR